MTAHVAIVGAGWSGLAAAIALLDAGAQVTLIDAAPQVGGRARRVAITLGDRTYALDNGQHLLIGAYREYLALARRVGLDLAQRLVTQPLSLCYPDGFRIQAPRAPAPWHLAIALATARGLSLRDRYEAARWVRRWSRRAWKIAQDCAAIDLFEGHPRILVERLWGPLCLAALNVRLEEASARVFLRILGDTVGASAEATDFLLPRGDLSRIFPDAAAQTIAAAGGTILLRSPARALRSDVPYKRWRVELRDTAVESDGVILALPPARCVDLLQSAGQPPLEPTIERLARIDTAPIATVYLRYSDSIRLARPLFALREDLGRGDYGQWVFDRGALEPACAGVLSVVVSGTGPHSGLAADELAAAVAGQISRAFGFPAPLAHAVLVEKRATIAPRPMLSRPATRLPLPHLYLAGDAADSPYPSTLEGSVRAGLAAARAVLEDTSTSAA